MRLQMKLEGRVMSRNFSDFAAELFDSLRNLRRHCSRQDRSRKYVQVQWCDALLISSMIACQPYRREKKTD